MKKLILSIAVTAIFVFALCHTASGSRTASDGSGTVADLPVIEETGNTDSGKDTSGYISIDGTVEEKEYVRESIDLDANSDLNYTWQDEPIRAEITVEDEDGLESVMILVPIEDDDCNKIKFVPPAGVKKIKDILVIVDGDVDDEEELTFVVPEFVKVVGETLVVDTDGFVIPELEVNVVPEDDESSESGESAVESVTAAYDLYVDAAAGLNEEKDSGVGSDVEIRFGDPTISAGSSGHCSMVGSASANPIAFLLMAFAFIPLAIKRK
ncbi:MAG: hypothetical protein ABH871_01485 [Pseudomonadota bacterium]